MGANPDKVLLIGYGNPGRLDDGLGPALASAIEKLGLPGVTVDSAYQLNVEDAAAVADHDVVVFADADVSGPEPFWFRRIEPEPALSYTTHSVEPQALIALAEQLFHAGTRAYLLGIRGYEFNEFGERFSNGAQENLAAAVAFLRRVLYERGFDAAAEPLDVLTDATCTHTKEDRSCKTENT